MNGHRNRASGWHRTRLTGQLALCFPNFENHDGFSMVKRPRPITSLLSTRLIPAIARQGTRTLDVRQSTTCEICGIFQAPIAAALALPSKNKTARHSFGNSCAPETFTFGLFVINEG